MFRPGRIIIKEVLQHCRCARPYTEFDANVQRSVRRTSVKQLCVLAETRVVAMIAIRCWQHVVQAHYCIKQLTRFAVH
jgi:hypothetical protein